MKKLSIGKKIITYLVGFSYPFIGLVLYWMFNENDNKINQEIASILKKSARLSIIIYGILIVFYLLFSIVLMIIPSLV